MEIRLTELNIVVRGSGDGYPDNRMYEEKRILCICSTYLRTYIMLCLKYERQLINTNESQY